MLDTLLSLSGTAITVIGTIALIIIGRLVFNKTIKDKRSLPYHRQFFTVIITLLGLFIAIALLPLPASVSSQILSVLGILLSAVIALSSTSLVGNAMSGIMLRLMKSFRAGDFIRFDDMLGRVTDISLFHTDIQLITRDILAVPNSLLAKKAVHITRRGGTFVNATVSIGYEKERSTVEAALKEAAEECGLAEPFVFIDELSNHSTKYHVYGLLEESNELLSKTSQLRSAVIDTLHRQNIEIASPQIISRREFDTKHHFIPEQPKKEEEAKTEKEEEEPIEELAFDRAEQAESIEKLYALQEKLNHELESVTNRAAEKEVSEEEVKRRKEVIKKKLERIQQEIQKRESEKEEQRLDENASE